MAQDKIRKAIEILSDLADQEPDDDVDNRLDSGLQPGPSSGVRSWQRSGMPPTVAVTRPKFTPSRCDKGYKQVLEAANETITLLKDARSSKGKGRSNKRSIKSEMASLFHHKKAKASEWRHRFVCLANPEQQRIPTTDNEKDELYKAGLGEKLIEFNNINADAEQIRDVLYTAFPKLENAGGFVLCKCIANTRNLEAMSQLSWISLQVLKERVGTSRTYIRPLQRSLDLSMAVDLPTGLLEECLNCGVKVPMDKLILHLEQCTSASKNNTVDLREESQEDELPPVNFLHKADSELPDIEKIENEMINTAIARSLCMSSKPIQSTSANQLSQLQTKLNDNLWTIIHVRRSDILKDALQEAKKDTFKAENKIKVVFVNESAIDHGGPRREFFRLLAINFGRVLMIGSDSSKFMLPDVKALQNKDFYMMGVYTVMSITQGGCGLPFLARCVFNYITGMGECTDVEVNEHEMPEGLLKLVVKKIRTAETTEDLKRCFNIDDTVPLLYDTGFTKSIDNISLNDRKSIVSSLIDYHLMVKVKAEMDQFKDGLATLGFLKMLTLTPAEWECYFLNQKKKVDAECIKSILKPEFSSNGANIKDEERAYAYFDDFLQECEDGTIDCDVTEILKFCSGGDTIPVCGFDAYPTLSFDSTAVLPTASTCEVELRIPSKYNSYSKFKEVMLLAIKGYSGFGTI